MSGGIGGIGQPGMPQPIGGVPPEALKNMPDPNTLADGDPRKELARQMGMLGAQGAAQGGSQGTSTGIDPLGQVGQHGGSQGLSGSVDGFKGFKHHADPAARADDPLGRPFILPSGGLPYGNHDGKIIISPMRGEQQEILSGAGDGLAASPVFRHVISACTNCQGFSFGDLTMDDFSAVMLNVIALSLGSDEIPMMPTCDKCQRQFNGTKTLGEWPARLVRRVGQGEAATWPPAETENESEDQRILRDMGLLDGEDSRSPQTVYTARQIEEPWEITLANGQRIGLRYLRVRDWEMAEEYAERSGSTGVNPDAALGRFLRARVMATLDGKNPGMLPLMEWARQAPMSLLVQMDEEYNRRSYGYVLSPMFRCPSCGHRFRQQLPLSGELLRRRSAFA